VKTEIVFTEFSSMILQPVLLINLVVALLGTPHVALVAVTLMFPWFQAAPASTVMLLEPCPDTMVKPLGMVQL